MLKIKGSWPESMMIAGVVGKNKTFVGIQACSQFTSGLNGVRYFSRACSDPVEIEFKLPPPNEDKKED